MDEVQLKLARWGSLAYVFETRMIELQRRLGVHFEAAFAPVFVGGSATFRFVLVPLRKRVTTSPAIEQSEPIITSDFEVRWVDSKKLPFAGCGRAVAAVERNVSFGVCVEFLFVGFT